LRIVSNLTATPAVKASLRSAFLASRSPVNPSRVEGPLAGKTYYGSYNGTRYALAVFSVPPLGSQDQPEAFQTSSTGAWRDIGDTGGCLNKIPKPLLAIWRLGTSC
jgi:hypothetical protein